MDEEYTADELLDYLQGKARGHYFFVNKWGVLLRCEAKTRNVDRMVNPNDYSTQSIREAIRLAIQRETESGNRDSD